MRCWPGTAPLAGLLAAVLVVGTSRAQGVGGTQLPEPVPVAPAPVASTPIPSTPIDPAPVAGAPLVPMPAPAQVPDGKWFPYGPVEIAATTVRPHTPVMDLLRKCNIGCYTTVHELGCGSFCSEANFIFGSCHSFYGEPCAVPPPRYPGQENYGQGGCGCGR